MTIASSPLVVTADPCGTPREAVPDAAPVGLSDLVPRAIGEEPPCPWRRTDLKTCCTEVPNPV